MNENKSGYNKDNDAPYPKGVIMECAKGSYVDLSNMPVNGTALTSLAIDTSRLTNPMVKLDFNAILSYSLSMLEELDLIFTLFRYENYNGRRSEMQQVAAWPFKILMNQTLSTETEQYAYVILEKDETVSLSYCDQLTSSGNYTYVMNVDSNYFNITSAILQSALMTATAQSVYQ